MKPAMRTQVYLVDTLKQKSMLVGGCLIKFSNVSHIGMRGVKVFQVMNGAMVTVKIKGYVYCTKYL